MASTPKFDVADFSEQERFEYPLALLGDGIGPRAGRPKKNGATVKWADFGFTRKEVWQMRRLAEIPRKEFEDFMTALRDGRMGRKRASCRAPLVFFGKINVPTENDFNETPVGDVAQSLLAPLERLLAADELSKHERRILKLAVLARLKTLFRSGM